MAVGTKADAKPEELRGTLPAGTRLRNYELISVLGHGGFGITYYARDTTLGREVAVKEYLPTSLALRENGTTVVPRSTQLAEDFIFFFQAEDGIRDVAVTGVQTCALPI